LAPGGGRIVQIIEKHKQFNKKSRKISVNMFPCHGIILIRLSIVLYSTRILKISILGYGTVQVPVGMRLGHRAHLLMQQAVFIPVNIAARHVKKIPG
jgi:hypothetical protein